MPTMNAKASATICLYGAPHCGYGYLACGPGMLSGGKPVPGGEKMFGDGEPASWRSLAESVWLALLELEGAGLPKGAAVTIFAPGGERSATVKSHCPKPYFGELAWGPAPVYTVSAEEIARAA